MMELRDRVAVVTGAGSGFGREIALLCAAEGMRVVLADVDMAGLEATRQALPSETRSIALRCDVSRWEDVEALASACYGSFGACHLLFNNAGVGTIGPAWLATLDDWSWTFGVNVMGVVHGIRAFVPRMLAAGGPGHVINTASVAGLVSSPGSSVYCASKHAVVGLTECLFHELRAAGAPIGVSLLCPAFVNTGFIDAERNRPPSLGERNPEAHLYEEQLRKALTSGRLSAADIARAALDAVREDRFYVLPHQRIKLAIETRMRDMLEDRPPTNTAR